MSGEPDEPGMQSRTIILPPSPESVREARRFVADILAASRWASCREAAVLLCSELVTNAVVHSASTLELSVETAGGSVAVRVSDADTGMIVGSSTRGEIGEGGRGMFLVDQIARLWGTEHGGGRKTVWFQLGDGQAATSTGTGTGTATEATGTRTSPSDQPDALVAQRRLASLVIGPDLQRHMTARQQLVELVERVVNALDANGCVLELDAGGGDHVSTGRLEGGRRELPLALSDQRYGRLLLFVDRPLGVEEDAFLQVAAERLAVAVAANSMITAARSRQAGHELLAEATELLAGSTSVAHTLSLAVQIVVPELAEWAVAYKVDVRRDPRRVTALHTEEARLDQLIDFVDHDPELAAAIADCCSSGKALPLPATVSIDGRRQYVIAIPLAARRNPSGVLLLGSREAPGPAAYLATLELGRRISLALENAELHEELTTAATVLQSSLLPATLPRLERLQLGVRYHSASVALSVGGDFYDAFVLPDDSVILAVGDVCGKGAAAAAITRTARDLLRLLLTDGWPTVDALRRLNRALLDQGGDDRYCTLAVARFLPDESGGRLALCLAGHPQPVLVTRSGKASMVGSPGGLLGILPDDSLALTETVAALEAGDSLVLYTDGVTEARRGVEMFGQAALTMLLGDLAASDPQRIADEVQLAASRFSAGEMRDDVAVLVAQIAGPPLLSSA